jgi:hypothetical protein
MDTLAVLALDLRTSREDPPDPLARVARWTWFELRERETQRAKMRDALARADRDHPEPPRLEVPA